jgi:hypothetical protein
MIVTPHEIVFGRSDHECDGKGMWHLWRKRKRRRGFWGGNLMERDHLAIVGVDGRIILTWMYKEENGRAWT